MRPELRGALLRAAGIAALAGVGLMLALLLQPVPVDVSLRAFAVALGGVAVALLFSVARLRPVFGSAPMRDRRRPAPDGGRPAALFELENAVDFGLSSGFDLHHRLRPALRRLAGERMAVAGIDLEREPERAEALLGAEAWELLRPDRPSPARRSRGTSVVALERIAAALERIV